MQGICHLSRRWHQQFCHSPSFGPHQRCLQLLLPARHYRVDRRARRVKVHQSEVGHRDPFKSQNAGLDFLSPSNALAPDNGDLVVRHFEQRGSDGTTRKRIDPAQPIRDEAEAVWQELQKVDEELRIARQGPFGPESPFMKQLPPDQREQVLKVVAEHSDLTPDEEDSLDLAEIDRIMEADEDEEDAPDEQLQVTLRAPKAHQAYVTRFNKALAEAQASEHDTAKTLSLWKWYIRCKEKVPGFLHIVPENVWHFLWKAQTKINAKSQILVSLGRDMSAAEHPMSDEQHLNYIWALHEEQETATAIVKWEEAKTKLQRRSSAEHLSKFYAVGVQIYAAVGRPGKAQRIAFAGVEDGVNPEILVHVVSGWAKSRDPDASTKAWAVYLKMRNFLGDKMQPEYYERISDAMMDEKRSEMALAVFKDMIERMRGSEIKTFQAYQQALGNISMDAEPETVEAAVNTVSLNMLLALPPKYHNKFFFASWIKKLLGQKRIEAASMVVDLMYERNIRPDAMHLNGIIGALLREKDSKSRAKAEMLAQEMVQARVDQMASFEDNPGLMEEGNIFRKTSPGLSVAKDHYLQRIRTDRPVPAANAETFAVLFDYHAERRQWAEFEELRRIMYGVARMRPNVIILNKFLSVEFEAKSWARFWAVFGEMVHRGRVDVESFNLAWQVPALQGSYRGAVDSPSRASSGRQLFAREMDWMTALSGPKRRRARQELDAHAYSTIVRAFCYQKDVPGLVCALHGLHAAFGAYPDPLSIQLVIGLVARSLPQNEMGRMGRRRANPTFRHDQTMLKSIAEVIDTLEANRKLELVESKQALPEEVEDPHSAVACQIRLDVMTEFMIVMMRKMNIADRNIYRTLRDISAVMHVDVSHLDIDGMLLKNQ